MELLETWFTVCVCQKCHSKLKIDANDVQKTYGETPMIKCVNCNLATTIVNIGGNTVVIPPFIVENARYLDSSLLD